MQICTFGLTVQAQVIILVITTGNTITNPVLVIIVNLSVIHPTVTTTIVTRTGINGNSRTGSFRVTAYTVINFSHHHQGTTGQNTSTKGVMTMVSWMVEIPVTITI